MIHFQFTDHAGMYGLKGVLFHSPDTFANMGLTLPYKMKYVDVHHI